MDEREAAGGHEERAAAGRTSGQGRGTGWDKAGPFGCCREAGRACVCEASSAGDAEAGRARTGQTGRGVRRVHDHQFDSRARATGGNGAADFLTAHA